MAAVLAATAVQVPVVEPATEAPEQASPTVVPAEAPKATAERAPEATVERAPEAMAEQAPEATVEQATLAMEEPEPPQQQASTTPPPVELATVAPPQALAMAEQSAEEAPTTARPLEEVQLTGAVLEAPADTAREATPTAERSTSPTMSTMPDTEAAYPRQPVDTEAPLRARRTEQAEQLAARSSVRPRERTEAAPGDTVEVPERALEATAGELVSSLVATGEELEATEGEETANLA